MGQAGVLLESLALLQRASPNSAHNTEQRLHADLCIPMRPRGRAKTSFPAIIAIPVQTQTAQGEGVRSKRRRAHKKALLVHRNQHCGDGLFHFPFLHPFPLLAKTIAQAPRVKIFLYALFSFCLLLPASLCWGW